MRGFVKHVSDNVLFQLKRVDISLIFPLKHMLWYSSEALLMSTHNICFHISEIFLKGP